MKQLGQLLALQAPPPPPVPPPPPPPLVQVFPLFVKPDRQSKSHDVPVHFTNPFVGAAGQAVHDERSHPTLAFGVTHTPPQTFSVDLHPPEPEKPPLPESVPPLAEVTPPAPVFRPPVPIV